MDFVLKPMDVDLNLRRFTLVKASWSFWCVGHLINFAVVPLHWRMIYMNVLSTGWGCFLSKMMANEEGGIDTPLDLLANAITGRDDGLPVFPHKFLHFQSKM